MCQNPVGIIWRAELSNCILVFTVACHNRSHVFHRQAWSELAHSALWQWPWGWSLEFKIISSNTYDDPLLLKIFIPRWKKRKYSAHFILHELQDTVWASTVTNLTVQHKKTNCAKIIRFKVPTMKLIRSVLQSGDLHTKMHNYAVTKAKKHQKKSTSQLLTCIYNSQKCINYSYLQSE